MQIKFFSVLLGLGVMSSTLTPMQKELIPKHSKPLPLPVPTSTPNPVVRSSDMPEPTSAPKPKHKLKSKPKPKKQKGRVIRCLITAYCPCYQCSEGYGRHTSTGHIATEGRTIAVDPHVIPYGSKVIIDGHTYRAEDCGGGVKGCHIDMFFDNHSRVDAYGKRYTKVIVLNKNGR